MKDLLTRSATALVIIPIFVYLLWQGGMIFAAALALLFILLGYEAFGLSKKLASTGQCWLVFGASLILFILGLSALYGLRQWVGNAPHVLIFVVMLIALDSGAYAFGKTIGGPKLAPKISPNKSWAGLIGAMICAGVIGAAAYQNIYAGLAIGLIMAPLAQTGDMLQSLLKRKAGVKDSGWFLPGHGGFWDRLDGYLPTAPLFLALLLSPWGQQYLVPRPYLQDLWQLAL